MNSEVEANQAGKILKLLFKDSEPANVMHNLAGILSMYYEQMSEPKPEFLIDGPEGAEISLSSNNDDVYETVSV